MLTCVQSCADAIPSLFCGEAILVSFWRKCQRSLHCCALLLCVANLWQASPICRRHCLFLRPEQDSLQAFRRIPVWVTDFLFLGARQRRKRSWTSGRLLWMWPQYFLLLQMGPPSLDRTGLAILSFPQLGSLIHRIGLNAETLWPTGPLTTAVILLIRRSKFSSFPPHIPGQPEWLEVKFAQRLRPSRVSIHEALAAPFVTGISWGTDSNNLVSVPIGTDSVACPGYFDLQCVAIPDGFLVDTIRIETSTSRGSYAEIDAVSPPPPCYFPPMLCVLHFVG